MHTLLNENVVVAKGSFMLKKPLLDGFVFWQDVGGGFVEVKQVVPSATVEKILNELIIE